LVNQVWLAGYFTTYYDLSSSRRITFQS